ncbi:MFS transporter [Thermococcus sp. 101 C5]|jgi:MFS family permease|uniref:MFS transporter n=2 Tax=Thermococcus TaxID=2263 RepID=UPI00128C4706|nr:MFS transporter [Thermococcus sp. 101 C5]MPW38821.1 MFS transporter [Thermococcus sp. 101 C5]
MKREQSLLQIIKERAAKISIRKRKKRNLLLLAISMFLANVSWGIAYPYLGVYMKALGGSLFLVGLLSVAFNLTSSIAQYPFGYLSDKTGRRKPFIAFGIFSSGIAYLFVIFATTPSALLGIRILQGVLSSSIFPAHTAFITELSVMEKVGSTFGFFNFVENMGYMLGNFVGSGIVKVLGIKSAFIISALISIVSAGIVMLIKETPHQTSHSEGLILTQESRESERVIFKGSAFKSLLKGKLGIFYLSVLFAMIASGQVYSVLSVYFEERFGSQWVGILFGVDSLAAALSAPFIGRAIDKKGAKKIFILSLVGYMVVFYGYGAVKSINLMIALSILSGVKWSAFVSAASAYVALKTEDRIRAQAMGMLNTMMSIGWVVGPLIGGYLSEISFGLNFLSSLVPLALAVALMFAPKNLKRH